MRLHSKRNNNNNNYYTKRLFNSSNSLFKIRPVNKCIRIFSFKYLTHVVVAERVVRENYYSTIFLVRPPENKRTTAKNRIFLGGGGCNKGPQAADYVGTATFFIQHFINLILSKVHSVNFTVINYHRDLGEIIIDNWLTS